jgi:hypothetical protein
MSIARKKLNPKERPHSAAVARNIQHDWNLCADSGSWRTLCFIREGKAELVSRKRNSLNERFPELREIGKLIKATTAVVDGEIVALDQDGLPRWVTKISFCFLDDKRRRFS